MNLTEERVKRVARGVITYQVLQEDPHFLLAQRRLDSKQLEFAGCWECFGGSAKPEDIDDMRKVVAREISEESGIKVVRVGDVVHEFNRTFLVTPVDNIVGEPPYARYLSMHFLVEAKMPERIILDPEEHMGCGWFTLKELAPLKHRIRNCSFEAIKNVHRLLVGYPSNKER